MHDPARALLALWNDVDPAQELAYEDWHAREHVPERLTVPGILWALRYRRAGAGPLPQYLTLYGLRDAQVLQESAYQRLLREPTPASRAMRPALRGLSRWVCTLEAQEGIERFAQLVVCTGYRQAVPQSLPADLVAARLVATRIPDAAPLPWLSADQATPIAGDRLEAWAGDSSWLARLAGPDATLYGRLPIG